MQGTYLSRAQRLDTPSMPPEPSFSLKPLETGGVTILWFLQKYGVVKLASATLFNSASRIKTSLGSPATIPTRWRAESYIPLRVVL